MASFLHENNDQTSDSRVLSVSCTNGLSRRPKQLNPNPHLPRLKTAASCNSLRPARVRPSQVDTVKLSCSSTPSLPSLCPGSKSVPKRYPPNPVENEVPDKFPFPTSPRPLRSLCHSPKTPSRKATRLRGSTTSPRSSPSSPSDRYIPPRRSSDSIANTFKASRSPERLSPAERLLRNNAASANPFERPRPLQTPPRPSEGRHRTQTTFLSRTGLRGGMLRSRAGSAGTIRTVGGSSHVISSPVVAIPDGRGGLLGSGTNAPISSANFFPCVPFETINDRFENKIAAALNIDQTSRLLTIASLDAHRLTADASPQKSAANGWWELGKWTAPADNEILEAPTLRDDFYCSVLALCPTTRTLAVGLANKVYLWSEEEGVIYPSRPGDSKRNIFVSSLSFSSGSDGNDILAIGRSNGSLSLWALDEDEDRFTCEHRAPISCVSFRPLARKKSNGLGVIVSTEELLVGDELGVVYYYSIEWETKRSAEGSTGDMRLLARIDIHSQQICGMEWSPDGAWFATGGNDNLCLLFATRDVTGAPESRSRERSSMFDSRNSLDDPLASTTLSKTLRLRSPSGETEIYRSKDKYSEKRLGDRNARTHRHSRSARSSRSEAKDDVREILPGDERQIWVHAAAIKAIAFCPWQRALLAVGGGSNDRAIHFYHTWSGACLGTIDVLAQVTSLIWSKTRREIVATFGFAQPEHSYRIAVFSWPERQQILAIPWLIDCRALYAIAYPGGPNDSKTRRSGEGERWWKRTETEGSIVIACSDQSVKFHEVWSEKARKVQHGPGILAWSDILEGLEGVDKEEDGTIR